jgi:hypothetical protein
MRCRRARAAITERRLRTPSPAAARELQLHLTSCRSCAADALAEEVLARELAVSWEDLAPPIDVRARVLREIAVLESVERREVPRRQLGLAVVATAAALGVAAWLAVSGFPPLLPRAVHETRWLLEGITAVLSVFAGPLDAAVAVLRSLGGIALDLLSALGVVLDAFAVVPQALVVFSVAAMASFTAYVVARDLRLLPAPRKEHRA